MRAPHVPDDALTPASVPDPHAPLEELLRFGHGYHAYRTAGSLPRVATIALDLHDRWTGDHDADAAATLDEPLPQLRIALFHTVRALEQDPRPSTDAETWVRVLVRSVGAAVARGPGR